MVPLCLSFAALPLLFTVHAPTAARHALDTLVSDHGTCAGHTNICQGNGWAGLDRAGREFPMALRTVGALPLQHQALDSDGMQKGSCKLPVYNRAVVFQVGVCGLRDIVI